MDVFSGATGTPAVTSRAVLSKVPTGEIHDFLCRRFLSLETSQSICTQLPHHSCLASSQTAHPRPTVPLTPPLPTTRPNPLNQPSPSSSLSKPPSYANMYVYEQRNMQSSTRARCKRAEHSRRDRKNVSYAGGGRMK